VGELNNLRGNRLIFGEGLIATLGEYTEVPFVESYVYHSCLKGEQHKKQRKMLNPVFSLANMRSLLPVIQPIADQLRTILTAELPADGCRSKSNTGIPCSFNYLQRL
jgi:hypothetical protein